MRRSSAVLPLTTLIPSALVRVSACLPAIPTRAPIRRVLVARPFLQRTEAVLESPLYGADVCVHRAVVDRSIHRVERRQRCALNVPVSAERVVQAYTDVAGGDARGEVGGFDGHDIEVAAFDDGVTFRSSRGEGQRGEEGEHADNGDEELHPRCGG
ncbi:hypothetical protein N7537_011864 [Penicillium hordei]|jgi:hypothetical protein|uniref:Secreted protein n=1 Tax=Penicillium hordei TaxID=40994 RepID=A0AAD6GS53_9EURO|nr:uncharacterized protein N7537_011864 [Penicillium hordei]KAJ5589186.1 hypothetical protein N7537_011864 [Penicillium hordei]